MRIFFAGDRSGNRKLVETTSEYVSKLPKGTMYLRTRNKWTAAIEIFVKTRRADVVVYTGCSKLKLYGMNRAAKLGKKVVYLMEDCLEYENALNGTSNSTTTSIERHMMMAADGIVAISSQFAKWLGDNYPMHRDKIYTVTNGIDVEKCKEGVGFRLDESGDIDESRAGIIAFGGGEPREKTKFIAKAIEQINSELAEGETPLSLTIVGPEGGDSKIIEEYSWVKILGDVPTSELYDLLYHSRLYVQNSSFESFGITSVEAALCGCSVLTSQYVGARELLNNPGEWDTIDNFDDTREIIIKLKYLIEHPNSDRIGEGLNREDFTWEARSHQLEQVLETIVGVPAAS